MISKTAIVIPDQHFPIHDQSAVNCALKILEVAKPDIFINLGDVGEWESVSAWRWRDKKQPPLEYQLPIIDEEIEAVNQGIDQFDEVLDKINEMSYLNLKQEHQLHDLATRVQVLRNEVLKIVRK